MRGNQLEDCHPSLAIITSKCMYLCTSLHHRENPDQYPYGQLLCSIDLSLPLISFLMPSPVWSPKVRASWNLEKCKKPQGCIFCSYHCVMQNTPMSIASATWLLVRRPLATATAGVSSAAAIEPDRARTPTPGCLPTPGCISSYSWLPPSCGLPTLAS